MTRFIPKDGEVLAGELIYRASEHSFDFQVQSSKELTRRIGNKGSTSLLIGTLQIEVGIETGTTLFVWGLHSSRAKWRQGSLPRISVKRGTLEVVFDEEPINGVSQGIAEVGEWLTTLDSASGWVCISSSNGDDDAEYYIEFAEGTIAGLLNNEIVSIWLNPIWR